MPNQFPGNSTSSLIPLASLTFSDIYNSEKDLLGKGGFGVVKKAVFQGHTVAVKSIKLEDTTTDGKPNESNINNNNVMDPLKAIQLFASEAEKMREARHERIVEFKGFVLEIFSIIMEYLPDGTLYDYIKANPAMPWLERYWCARDVAEGMAFLHSKTKLNGRR